MAPKGLRRASPALLIALANLQRALAADVTVTFPTCGTGNCYVASEVARVEWPEWETKTLNMEEYESFTKDTTSTDGGPEIVFHTITEGDAPKDPPPQTINLGDGKSTVITYPDAPFIATVNINWEDEDCSSAAAVSTTIIESGATVLFEPESCTGAGNTRPPAPVTKSYVLRLRDENPTASPTPTSGKQNS